MNLELEKSGYEVLSKIWWDPPVYIVKKDGRVCAAKFISGRVGFAARKTGFSPLHTPARLIANAKMFSDLGIGPEYIEHIPFTGEPSLKYSGECPDGCILIMKYIEHFIDLNRIETGIREGNPLIAKVIAEIRAMIEKLHSLEVYHGDLHFGNIRYELSNGEVKIIFIDTDYAFTKKEYEENENIRESVKWAHECFTLDDFIESERMVLTWM
jgi:hypothetical protein